MCVCVGPIQSRQLPGKSRSVNIAAPAKMPASIQTSAARMAMELNRSTREGPFRVRRMRGAYGADEGNERIAIAPCCQAPLSAHYDAREYAAEMSSDGDALQQKRNNS